MSENISKGMKNFWKNKSAEEMTQINSKRSDSNSRCVYIKIGESRPQACNIENLFSKIAEGYRVIRSEKNKAKIEKFFTSFPENFFTKK